MANLTTRTEDTAPTSDDQIYVLNDPAGTPGDKKSSLGNAIKKAHGLADSTVVGVASGVLTSGTDVAVADGGTGASTAGNARTNLGLAIGSDVQAYDPELAALAGLTSAADKVPYFTGSGTAAVADFSSFGRSLVDDAAASNARTTLGLGTVATLDSDTDGTLAANSDSKVATQKATKTYVDAVASGLSPKNAVTVGTTAALPTNTYSNGASGVGATLTAVATGVLTVDGQTVALDDRILVKDESSAANNGIYKCTVAGAIGVAYILTRATDMDQAADVPGAYTFVENGTTNSGSGFVVASAGPYTMGTTAINWTQFSGVGEITAGAALTKTGNTIDVAVDGSTIEVSSDALRVKDSGITYAKIQNVSATSRLLGRTTAGAGVVEEITVGGDLTQSGSTFTIANSAVTDGKISATADVMLSTITFVIDGGGSAITTGIKGDLEIPFNCTINRATLLADQSGSIVVDIWKDTYANYPPTVADTITASAKPTISTATKSQDATLTGWTTSITAGDTLRFNVDSITTVTRVTLSLKVTKT